MPTPPPPEHSRWPKGVSGNPGGRPKKTLTAALEAELELRPELLKALIQKGIKKALEGDFRYWKELYDRLDGKVPTPVDLTNTEFEGNDYVAIKPRVNDSDIDRAPKKVLE